MTYLTDNDSTENVWIRIFKIFIYVVKAIQKSFENNIKTNFKFCENSF